MDKKTVKRSLFSYIFLIAIIVSVFYFVNVLNQKVNSLSYSEFLNELESDNVSELTITPNSSQGVYKLTGKLKSYGENETFSTRATLTDETIKQIYELNNKGATEINIAKDPESSWFLIFLVNVFPFILLIVLGYYFISKQMGSANKSMDFGKSRARLNEDRKKVVISTLSNDEEESDEENEEVMYLRQVRQEEILRQYNKQDEEEKASEEESEDEKEDDGEKFDSEEEREMEQFKKRVEHKHEVCIYD